MGLLHKAKLLFQKVKPFFNFKTLAAIVGCFLLYLFFTSSLFYVNSIEVTQINNKKYIKESDIFACTKKFLGKNIFSLDINEVKQSVEGCTVLTNNVKVNKILPSSVEITIDEIMPVIKFVHSENCYLVDEKVVIKKIDLDKCSRYTVPELKGITQVDNLFVYGVVVKIIKLSESVKAEVPESFEQTTEGQTTFIIAKYSGYSVLFSPNISPEYYVTQYINIINGLTERQESFSQIDFRFDRVIVR